MDDTVGELALATLVVPFAVAFLAGLVLLVTAPKNDQGVWMRPLGSESWVSPNVRLTGILSLYFVMCLFRAKLPSVPPQSCRPFHV